MSIIDFITGLFRDPANLRAYLDNPIDALRAAGLPDATPEEVEALLPTVAESMPSDHPLQSALHAGDPPEALRRLDIEELCVPPDTSDRAIGDADDHVIVDATKAGRWESAVVGDKGIGPVADDPLTPEIEGDFVEPVQAVEPPYSDHAVSSEDLVDPDLSSAAWAKAIE